MSRNETGQYTNISFENHKLKIEKADFCVKYTLYLPDRGNYHKVVFINSGTMSVHGDFGNWIFCREFIPQKGSRVSAEYWAEKLRISSAQESHDFDPEATLEVIKEYRDNAVEDDNGELADFYETIIEDGIPSSESEYYHDVYNNLPDGYDPYDIIPVEKSIKFWLKCVFDAWEAVCRKLPEEKSNV